jgi:lipopolysaccharide export LptBFGC system permease protein LptF
MRALTILLSILFVLTLLSAIRNAIELLNAGSADVSYNVGYLVGSFLVPMAMLIGALMCWDKHKKKCARP